MRSGTSRLPSGLDRSFWKCRVYEFGVFMPSRIRFAALSRHLHGLRIHVHVAFKTCRTRTVLPLGFLRSTYRYLWDQSFQRAPPVLSLLKNVVLCLVLLSHAIATTPGSRVLVPALPQSFRSFLTTERPVFQGGRFVGDHDGARGLEAVHPVYHRMTAVGETRCPRPPSLL